MKKNLILFSCCLILAQNLIYAQSKDPIVQGIIKEASENSQLKKLAQELTDGIGPRLVGTPQMKQAHDWAVSKYQSWGISAKNEQWGEWRGWERGITHIDLVHPRVESLEGMQLAWSPSTSGKAVTAETIILADVADSIAFQNWLPAVKGKFVMISMEQPTGRDDKNWEEFATKESFEKMKVERSKASADWRNRMN